MFSTVKHLDPNKVIQFAQDTLSVTSEKLKDTMITEDVIALDSVLWKLHSSAIKTISALIKWYTLFNLSLKVYIFLFFVDSLFLNFNWIDFKIFQNN